MAVSYIQDSKVNKSDVVNNLTTTDSGKVLDARAGKTLDDKITTANTNISGITSNLGVALITYTTRATFLSEMRTLINGLDNGQFAFRVMRLNYTDTDAYVGFSEAIIARRMNDYGYVTTISANGLTFYSLADGVWTSYKLT